MGLAILAVHGGLYLVATVLAVASPALWINLPAAALSGVLIGMLFIIGHDASHGVYMPGRLANHVVARLAFLPSMHSASLWEVVHNRRHHGKTNLRGHDDVWAPMTKAEYDRAGHLRRLRERLYRSSLGPVVYYLGEFWPYRVLLPLAPEARASWRRHLPDALFVVAASGAALVGLVRFGSALHPAMPWWRVLLLGWVLPFCVFNYIMALTIYVQHTHPRVPWFDDASKWSSYDGNIRGTTHVELPVRVLPLWNIALGHTAHHAMPSIPLYNLSEAQAQLLQRCGDDIVRYRFGPSTYLAITRACKLYDFDRACWTDFEGAPTDLPR